MCTYGQRPVSFVLFVSHTSASVPLLSRRVNITQECVTTIPKTSRRIPGLRYQDLASRDRHWQRQADFVFPRVLSLTLPTAQTTGLAVKSASLITRLVHATTEAFCPELCHSTRSIRGVRSVCAVNRMSVGISMLYKAAHRTALCPRWCARFLCPG
ncbi:hypothetical protein C8Q70DRAFT_277166 [Cubamyces menziesii]|nr:hypothetical protein C8Q70DRAFT_277166 [Cubamyces menziesii]